MNHIKKFLLFENREVLYNCKECNWKGWLPMKAIVTCPKCGNINDIWIDGEEIPKRHKKLNDEYKKKKRN